MRMAHGGIYHWELENGGQKLQMGLPVRFASNELLAIKQAVLSGLASVSSPSGSSRRS